MLGVVLGTNGSLPAFFEAVKRSGDQLNDAEYAVLKELIRLTRDPGNVLNLAQKMQMSDEELNQHLQKLQNLGLIDRRMDLVPRTDELPMLLVR